MLSAQLQKARNKVVEMVNKYNDRLQQCSEGNASTISVPCHALIIHS